MRKFVPLFAAAALIAAPATVEAKGCIKGAVAGAVAGHYMHHHAVAGAMAGCVAGHAIAKHHDKMMAQKAAAPAAAH